MVGCPMKTGAVLISGAGIAGPTLAFWLKAAGFEPTLIEHAPELRTGGYVIDFWGLGYDIAERMGLLPKIHRIGYHIREMRIVNGRGERISGLGTRTLNDLTGGRFVTLARSDLSRLLFETIKDRIEAVFGDEIAGMEDDGEGVEVQFKRSRARRFDLVIGADGLHSKVRGLSFGAQDRFEVPLGYLVAAFEVQGYRPRDEQVYIIFNEPGRMLGRFALHEDRTLFLFVFTAGEDSAPLDLPGQKALLRARYGDRQWECPRILDELDHAQDLYFDRVSQIRMNAWSKSRVALVGDAAFCVSLMAGQGAALGMTAAYVLAGELAKAGRRGEAFANYESLLRGFIASKQSGAARFSAAFAPKTRSGLFLRNQVVKASAIPGVAKFAFAREITDTLRLPQYSWTSPFA
jgi:2-polyprenyl-6-methoxyphenol hydroxylase-like FAD-dependent oxidoreductase